MIVVFVYLCGNYIALLRCLVKKIVPVLAALADLRVSFYYFIYLAA